MAPDQPGHGRRPAPILALIVALLASACSGSSASPSPPAASSGPAVASPGTGLVGGAPGSPGADVSLPPGTVVWPLDVIDATIALAALDNEIKKAGTDLQTAAAKEDLKLLLSASTGLRNLAAQSLPNARTLTKWPDTTAAGNAYVDVLGKIESSAGQLATAITKGDAPGIATGAQAVAGSIEQYRGVRGQIVDLANKAIEMRRLLLQ
jgi:hypothetical protein